MSDCRELAERLKALSCSEIADLIRLAEQELGSRKENPGAVPATAGKPSLPTLEDLPTSKRIAELEEQVAQLRLENAHLTKELQKAGRVQGDEHVLEASPHLAGSAGRSLLAASKAKEPRGGGDEGADKSVPTETGGPQPAGEEAEAPPDLGPASADCQQLESGDSQSGEDKERCELLADIRSGNAITALRHAPERLREEREVVLAAVRAEGSSLEHASQALRSSKDVVLEAVGEYGPALEYASKELQGDQEVVLKAVRQDGTALEHASEDLLTDRDFLLQAVKQTKAWWLCRFADSELQEDEEFERQCKETAGTGIVFTYYDRYTCFEGMRLAFRTAGASVPGGEAYDMVMEELKHPLGEGSTATVWFGDEPVFGHAAADGAWVHPSHDCGRDEVSVPAMEERDAKWHSTVDSRSVSLEPQAGEKYKCWCCHWLREVRRHHEDGEAICCAISNIYREDWVLFHGAGSSELSDEDAEKHGLPKETFRNGRPDGWGKGQIRIDGHDFDRRAPVHPRTQKPLGVGCRWERQALDGMEFPVYAFFKP